MYTTAYQRLFQGFLLILLDLRIQFFDILPDFVGYILVFRALGILASQHLNFSKAKPFALALIFLSLTNLLPFTQANLLEYSFSTQELGWLVIGQAIILTELFLLYWIIQGIYEVAKDRGNEELQEKAQFRWKFYFIATSVLLVYTPFALNLDPAWVQLMILFVVALFLAMLLILGLIRSAGRELKD
ncbi:hypothetical protein [Ammoniphilus sp. CFH 90114]|uniref:hypothetical protein n=1 Tax=Ammoniphilus sp. CFH 90114 TaxID=2493665 RepID=UPI00100F71B7|nr:hypothetical protein [Ammoniphilus sp. CFH 90114]RXT01914.1 hypothetical protein EIZ39_25300 [Ammoniphilus sp. CFH 90114]